MLQFVVVIELASGKATAVNAGTKYRRLPETEFHQFRVSAASKEEAAGRAERIHASLRK